MLLKGNTINVCLEDLLLMLGEDETSFRYDPVLLIPDVLKVVVTLNCIDVKFWLRVVLIHIDVMRSPAELAGCVSLLLECPALQRVRLIVSRYPGKSRSRYGIETLSCAFKALAEKLGRRLTFHIRSPIPDDWPKRYEGFFGDLEQLEDLVRDGKSNLESEGRDLEEDEQL